jgi:predicted Fe-S protein YdhL (DUF1289 family)
MDVRSFFKLEATKPAMDRIADITAQIAEERKTGRFSFEYDLGWTHDSKQSLVSGGDRQLRHVYLGLIDSDGTEVDVAKVSSRIKEREAEVTRMEKQLREMPAKVNTNAEYVTLKYGIRDEKNRIAQSEGILTNVANWKPENCYWGTGYNYNTKEHNTERHDAVVEQALDDYKLFADDLNKTRGNPIRNIAIRTRINADGSRTLDASWSIWRENFTHYYFGREYQILPEFKFLRGTTLKSIADDEQREKDEKEAKRKALADKKAERERDPVYILKKKIVACEDEMREWSYESQRAISKRFPYGVKRTADEEVEWKKMYEAHNERHDVYSKTLEKLRKELSKAKKDAKANAPK